MSQKPYGVAIHDAIARGDARRLDTLVKQARLLHEQHGDLAKAIKAGESALKKSSGAASGGGKSAAASSKKAPSKGGAKKASSSAKKAGGSKKGGTYK
jgi:hypothetical protein